MKQLLAQIKQVEDKVAASKSDAAAVRQKDEEIGRKIMSEIKDEEKLKVCRFFPSSPLLIPLARRLRLEFLPFCQGLHAKLEKRVDKLTSELQKLAAHFSDEMTKLQTQISDLVCFLAIPFPPLPSFPSFLPFISFLHLLSLMHTTVLSLSLMLAVSCCVALCCVRFQTSSAISSSLDEVETPAAATPTPAAAAAKP